MDQERKALRAGLTALTCACLIRLWSMGLPGQILSRLAKPNTEALLLYLETGRNVRFSLPLEAFSPDFAESPPASAYFPAVLPREDGVQLTNTSSKQVDTDALLAKPLEWQLRGQEPTVLILHTHTTESYTRSGETYRETSSWRTADEGYNMLSVGARVAQLLAEAGIPTIQDRSFHDYPSYNGSYADARKSIQAYLEAYPTIRLVLDLHRDASDSGMAQMRPVCTVEGQECAQLMLVLGANHEEYEDNLALGLKLHSLLEQQCAGIMRPLQLRPQRFNQDLCPGALLVEVGAAGNTHPSAVLAAEQLARAIIALADGASGI